MHVEMDRLRLWNVSFLLCRNWFPWLSSRIASSTSEVTLRPASTLASRPNVNPTWRHSNPDSHYGFRQPPAAGRYQMPTSGTTPADLSHYSAIPSGETWSLENPIFFCNTNKVNPSIRDWCSRWTLWSAQSIVLTLRCVFMVKSMLGADHSVHPPPRSLLNGCPLLEGWFAKIDVGSASPTTTMQTLRLNVLLDTLCDCIVSSGRSRVLGGLFGGFLGSQGKRYSSVLGPYIRLCRFRKLTGLEKTV